MNEENREPHDPDEPGNQEGDGESQPEDEHEEGETQEDVPWENGSVVVAVGPPDPRTDSLGSFGMRRPNPKSSRPPPVQCVSATLPSETCSEKCTAKGTGIQ